MKLKTDDQGNAVLDDGKPVYVHDDGKEVAVDVAELFRKIPALNDEAKKHRLAAKEAADKLAAFADMDPEEARKALATVANLDAKKLVDAGEVEKLKADLSRGYQEKTDKLTADLAKQRQAMVDLQVRNAFAGSDFVRQRLSVPPDMAETFFRRNIAVDDDGRLTVNGFDGQTILSREKPGEPAAFEEAIEALVAQYPHRDAILRGGQPGSGSTGGGTGPGNVTNFRNMTVQQKAALAAKLGPDAYAQRVAASLRGAAQE